VIVAVGVNTDGQREVLGLKVRASEAEPFWTEFLRGLNRRGLRGVKLVISDSHEGIEAATAKVLKATWQRCRVHFMRNALAHAGKTQRRMVSAAIGTVFVRSPPTRRARNGADPASARLLDRLHVANGWVKPPNPQRARLGDLAEARAKAPVARSSRAMTRRAKGANDGARSGIDEGSDPGSAALARRCAGARTPAGKPARPRTPVEAGRHLDTVARGR
jgi:hypothetical protein